MKYTDWMSGEPVEKEWPRRIDWQRVAIVLGLFVFWAIVLLIVVTR